MTRGNGAERQRSHQLIETDGGAAVGPRTHRDQGGIVPGGDRLEMARSRLISQLGGSRCYIREQFFASRVEAEIFIVETFRGPEESAPQT
jgi:hypothetical protein